jgi:hypothetical protein
MSSKAFHRQRDNRYRARVVDRRRTRQKFLIVCEGEKTEPNYFRRFPLPQDCVVDVRGIGANTVSLVREVMRLRSEGNYDQVWCVFDRDNFPAENFNEAIRLAKANDIQVAYSNEAFELWYILHFDYLDTGITRNDYISYLSKALKKDYQKNSQTIYKEILPLQPTAIRNARRLLAQYNPPNPEADKPSTTVHLLVEQLNQLFLYEALIPDTFSN